MARLMSEIGIEQRKHTAYARKAFLYREMAAAITMGATHLIPGFPKSVPRGHPAVWYLDRAEKAEQVSGTAREMAVLLRDMEHRNALDRMSHEDVWRMLMGDEQDAEDPGLMKGWLPTIADLAEMLAEELPSLVPKLSIEQRLWCQHFIRTKMETLIDAFDGRS
jgi:hypothetical protein